jgi:hypothetical protein
VIGINDYDHASPLRFAVNDAEAVAESLIAKHGFEAERVTLLRGRDATRSRIMSAYMQLSDPEVVQPDDRIFIFFAGHGHTVSGRRGEAGFLVPVDGRPTDLATLVRWDELTRNSDLIPAKHMLFLMDACYGGLALTRKGIPSGSMRLMTDMLQRFSRQVLTAGKANELVADGGGVRPGHSLFTAHLLNALEGAASITQGVLTANGVMSYVYDKVGTDQLSQQTPHFGFLDGDGDFIFSPYVNEPAAPSNKDDPILIQTSVITEHDKSVEETPIEVLKRLLADERERIRLDDFISAQIRHAIQELNLERFPANALTAEQFEARLIQYEQAVAPLQTTVMLLARWATPEQLRLLTKIFSRIAEAEKPQGGTVRSIGLAWYPAFFLAYLAGIAAVSEGRYDVLRIVLVAPVDASYRGQLSGAQPLVLPMVYALTDAVESFKQLPNFERRHTPRSDYLYQRIQPILEDELFLGRSYERVFNEFEVLFALSFADMRPDSDRVWGPPGRFAWQRDGMGSYDEIVSQATRQGDKWPALKAGFFSGSSERFAKLSTDYGQLLSSFHWW